MPVVQLDSIAHAYWDDTRETTDHAGVAIPYHELKKYDARRGPQWTTAVKVGSGICEPWIDTENWFPGSELWQVRIRASSGKFSASSATTTPTLVVPASHVNGDSHDAHTLGFPDTKTDCEVDEDGDLRLSVGETTATYVSDEIDMTSTALWRISHLVHVEASDFRFKIGRTIADISGDTIGDHTGDPAGRGLDTDYVTDRDLAGIKLYDPQVTWTLEATVYETSGAPGTYQEFTPGNYYGRYIKFKLTINRDVGADLTVSGATNATPIVITTSAAHGLLDGQRVRVYGVGGNTAANGTWRITYLTTTTFSLDDSVGNGAYTTGGTVVADIDAHVTGLELAYSKTAESGDVINVQKFGAVADGDTGTPTNNYTAILAAMTEAKNRTGGLGGVVFFPAGVYATGSQLKVPNRVWLVGENSFASRIKALSTFAGASHLIRLGEGTGTVFNCRLHHIGVAVNDVASVGGVYSNEIQEQSGCTFVDVSGYRTYGIEFALSGATAASLVGVEHIQCFGSASGSTGGIRFTSVAGQVFAKHVSVVPSGGGPYTDGILIDGGDALLEQIHIEQHTDGIHFTNGTAGTARGVYGHSSVTNLIHLGTGCNVTLRSINAASSTNILVDDARSITVTSGETGFIQEYANNEIKIGPVSLGAGSQTAIVDVGFPALAGVADEVVTRLVAQILAGKTFVEPIVMNSGQTAAQRVEVNNTSQEIAGNILDIPNLGEDGSGGSTTRSVLLSARVTSGGSPLWQQARQIRLIDAQISRNGQLTPWALLSSSDQTGAGTVRIPDLGGASTYDLLFAHLAQTFTAAQTFSAKVTINGGIDVDNSSALRISDNDASEQFVTIDSSVQTADRTITIPALTGNRTIAFINEPQTFAAALTFSATLTVNALIDASGGTIRIQSYASTHTGSTDDIWIEDDGGGTVVFWYRSADGSSYGIALSTTP